MKFLRQGFHRYRLIDRHDRNYIPRPRRFTDGQKHRQNGSKASSYEKYKRPTIELLSPFADGRLQNGWLARKWSQMRINLCVWSSRSGQSRWNRHSSSKRQAPAVCGWRWCIIWPTSATTSSSSSTRKTLCFGSPTLLLLLLLLSSHLVIRHLNYSTRHAQIATQRQG